MVNPKAKIGDAVVISWLNIGHTDAYIELDELEKLEPCPAVSVGYLMVLNDKKVIISSTTVTGDTTYRCSSCFPRRAISTITKLEVVTNR